MLEKKIVVRKKYKCWSRRKKNTMFYLGSPNHRNPCTWISKEHPQHFPTPQWKGGGFSPWKICLGKKKVNNHSISLYLVEAKNWQKQWNMKLHLPNPTSPGTCGYFHRTQTANLVCGCSKRTRLCRTSRRPKCPPNPRIWRMSWKNFSQKSQQIGQWRGPSLIKRKTCINQKTCTLYMGQLGRWNTTKQEEYSPPRALGPNSRTWNINIKAKC